MIAVPNKPLGERPRSGFGSLIPIDAAGDKVGDAIPLLQRDLLIGRRESCDIVLPFPNVSAEHCWLVFRDGHWKVEDLESRNGVRVNGIRVKGTALLEDGDTLSVAKHLYRLRYAP